MEFVFEPALLDYMEQKNRKNIIVQVAESNHSDIEIQEIHVHLITDKLAEFNIKEKKYRAKETGHGRVLLPNYPLEYDKEVIFSLKKFLCFRTVGYKGIRF